MPSPLTLAQIDFAVRASAAFVGGVRLAWDVAGRPPVIVTSFQRTPLENRNAGGDPGSQHLIGTAVDLARLESRQASKRLVDAAWAVGLVAVDEVDHVHLQLFRRDLRVVERFFPQLVV